MSWLRIVGRAPLLAGQTIAEVGDRLDGDLLGDDPYAADEAALAEARSAWSMRRADGRTVHLSYGEEGAAEYALQLAADHLIHGWDVAASTGQDRMLPLAQVEAVAEWFVERESAVPRSGVDRRAGDACLTKPRHRIGCCAMFGRDARWSM